MTANDPAATNEVTITVGGETRTVTMNLAASYGGVVGGVVAQIGRGWARYPAHVQLHRVEPGAPTPRGATRVTDSGGREWSYHLGTVVRNRQARIVAWADVAPATNDADQTRRAGS